MQAEDSREHHHHHDDPMHDAMDEAHVRQTWVLNVKKFQVQPLFVRFSSV